MGNKFLPAYFYGKLEWGTICLQKLGERFNFDFFFKDFYFFSTLVFLCKNTFLNFPAQFQEVSVQELKEEVIRVKMSRKIVYKFITILWYTIMNTKF